MPSVASTSNTTYASRTDTTVTAPSGIQDGDLLYAFIFTTSNGGTAPTPTPPSGFTQLPSSPTSVTDEGSFNGKFWAYVKTASSESGDYTFSHSTCSSQGLMLRVSAGNATGVVDASNTGTGSTTTFTGVTTTQDNALVMVVAHDWGDTANNLSPPSGSTPTFTEHVDVTLVYAASGVLATAGSTGDKTMTNNTTGINPWAGYTIGINPEEAPSGGVIVSWFVA